MRLVQLGRIALEAEGLRLRQHAKRAVTRAVCGGLAVIMLCGVLLFAHIAAWYWLRETLAPHHVALIFMGIDLALTAILAWLALRSSPGTVEREALEVRRRALAEAEQSVTLSALLFRAADMFMATRGRR